MTFLLATRQAYHDICQSQVDKMATIEFLGLLSDRCGRTQELTLPRSIEDVASLRTWLNNNLEGEPLASPSIRAIVNGKVAGERQSVSNEDTIAFFPPVGGG